MTSQQLPCHPVRKTCARLPSHSTTQVNDLRKMSPFSILPHKSPHPLHRGKKALIHKLLDNTHSLLEIGGAVRGGAGMKMRGVNGVIWLSFYLYHRIIFLQNYRSLSIYMNLSAVIRLLKKNHKPDLQPCSC